VPVWDGLEPRGGVCLNVFLRWNEGWKQTQLTLVSKKEDLLGLLEESPSSEASFLPDVGQRRGVVDSSEDGRLMVEGSAPERSIKQKAPYGAMHLNVSLSLSSKAQRHTKILLT
jgi:hypothetical protein